MVSTTIVGLIGTSGGGTFGKGRRPVGESGERLKIHPPCMGDTGTLSFGSSISW